MKSPAIYDQYKGKKVLLTGGRGFIGSRLKKSLADTGAQVYSLDSRPAGERDPREIVCDLRDGVSVREVVESVSPEMVFHLAAAVDRNQAPEMLRPMLETNLFGSLNLFEALRGKSYCRAVVVSGTAEEYGRAVPPFLESYHEDPVGPYSFSKVCVSHLTRLFFNVYGLPVMVLRPTLAYGPGQEQVMFIPSLLGALSRGEKFAMTAGEQTRDFIYVDDLVKAYMLAGLSSGGFGEIYNIGSGAPCRIADLARMAAKLFKKEHLLDIGAKDYRSAEIMDYRVDISKARKTFGWSPETGLEAGLRLTLEGCADAK